MAGASASRAARRLIGSSIGRLPQMPFDQGRDLVGASLDEIMFAALHDVEAGVGKEAAQIFSDRHRTDWIVVAPEQQYGLRHARQLGREVGVDLPDPGCRVGIVSGIGLPPFRPPSRAVGTPAEVTERTSRRTQVVRCNATIIATRPPIDWASRSTGRAPISASTMCTKPSRPFMSGWGGSCPSPGHPK